MNSMIFEYGEIIGWTVIGYAIGSILFGSVLTRLAGMEDLRKIGSGNVGATNVLRSGKKLLAILTLLGDYGKGVFIVYLSIYFSNDYTIGLIGGIGAIIGHNYPLQGFSKGGKGVATSFGVHVAWLPAIGGISMLAWIATVLISRRSSVASLAVLVCLPIVVWFWNQYIFRIVVNDYWFVGSAIIGCLSVWRHKENIKRIFTGQEGKISFKKVL